MNRSLIKTCRIGGHEEGPGGEARPSTLLDYLQEAAGEDARGRPVVRATSSWAILDLATRRPIPLAGVMPEHWADERRAIVTDFPPLPAVQQVEREARLPVMLRDLDVNVHVNHVVYVQWALETVPSEAYGTARPIHADRPGTPYLTATMYATHAGASSPFRLTRNTPLGSPSRSVPSQ